MPTPTSTSTIRIFHIWHLLNGLIHLLYESTYVYNCFTSSIPNPIPGPSHPDARFFLGRRDRLYGNAYSTNVLAKPWQDYARADRRYAGVDLTTLSLEMVTVGVAGPMALWVGRGMGREGGVSGGTWFWAVVLASGELYGGLLNFLPEWLSGCESLDTGDAVHLWFHIVFFNAVWALFPLWVLKEAYSSIRDAFAVVERAGEQSLDGGKAGEDMKSK